jgi:hypothetical protein
LRCERAGRTVKWELQKEIVVTVPVLVQQTNGQFIASLVGSSELRCVRSSRAEAIAALHTELSQRMAADELLNLEIQPWGVSSLAGQFQDDPDLPEICKQIYLERDAQQPQ